MHERSETATNSTLLPLFERLRANEGKLAATSAKERIRKLRALEKILLDRRVAIHEALCDDFRKPNLEIDAVEIYPVVKEIRHTARNLRAWMRGRKAATPLAFIGSRSHVLPEPKGVSLIISPWNYPVNLTLVPLVHAIAAGCPAVLKPSEYVPNVAALMKDLLAELFPADEVILLSGGVSTGRALLELPFRHIYFTGSTKVGRQIMRSAADHLASVTLELGGKSPAVVDQTANLKRAARRIALTKWVNAGQTCIAPDYVLVNKKAEPAFTRALIHYTENYFPWKRDASAYSSVINAGHLAKLEEYLHDAIETGADIWSHGEIDNDRLIFPPTLLFDPKMTSKVMQEEIFGPVLPVITYDSADEAIELINSLDRPLTLSVFSESKSFVEKVIGHTTAGNTCINHCSVHFYNSNIPFGGVNESGIGKSHGFDGFREFSNERAVLRQTWSYSPHEWLHHPYSKSKQKFVELVMKWL